MGVIENYNHRRERIEVHSQRLNRHLERYVEETKEPLSNDRAERLEMIRVQAQEVMDILLDEHESLGRLVRQLEMMKLNGKIG